MVFRLTVVQFDSDNGSTFIISPSIIRVQCTQWAVCACVDIPHSFPIEASPPSSLFRVEYNCG